MAEDKSGGLTQEQLEALNQFVNEKAGEEGMLCPVTGEPTAITSWHAPETLLMLPGQEGGPGYEAYPLTSPAGGVVLISAAKLREWQDGRTETDDTL